jgi:hypothetical protein
MNNKVMKFKALAGIRWINNSMPFSQMWFASLTVCEQSIVKKYCEKINFKNNMFLSYYDNIVLCWFLFKDSLK